MSSTTLLRAAEMTAMRRVSLAGKVLDLGGEKDSGYLACFTGDFTVTTVNVSTEANPDIVADLEHPLPFEDGSYDAVLLINVLEHVFEYRALLAECARVVCPGGTIVIVVPFLFPYHPSPGDYHRYSRTALERALTASGFGSLRVEALGSGVFAARTLMLERLLPQMLQTVLAPITHSLATALDALFAALARMLRKKYAPADYALGFLVEAQKPNH